MIFHEHFFCPDLKLMREADRGLRLPFFFKGEGCSVILPLLGNKLDVWRLHFSLSQIFLDGGGDPQLLFLGALSSPTIKRIK